MDTEPRSPSFADIQRRSAAGFLALALRGGTGKIVTIIATVILSRLLVPADFGAFAILMLPIGWLNLLADAGIGAALIQRPFLSPDDEQAGFTLRLLLALFLGAILILAAGAVSQLYDLSGQTTNMIRLLALGPVLSALGTIPGIRLNRDLRFDRLALAELGSLLVGQGTAVALAVMGAGLWSLVAGSLMTVLTGSLLVNLFAPWRPRMALPVGVGQSLLRFGLPYQGQGLVHLAKDQAVPALGGLFFASAQLGYLTWSQDVARWPRLPADYAARVAFPAFARLQQNAAELNQLLGWALRLISWLSFGAAAYTSGHASGRQKIFNQKSLMSLNATALRTVNRRTLMLDPGRYFAEAIYFLQYTLAQILWAINRATLSIAVIAESINSWVTDNVGYFVELLVNALSAPLGGMFILALTALGFWYALNNIVPTNRWVDPSKLFTYGLIAFFFFSSPIVVIDMMEDVRTALNAGIDTALIDGAAGDIFDTSMDGTDVGLPAAIPDVNSDGAVGSFDLVSAFMLVANIDELDSSEFPVDFEAAYYPFGDPSGIDLSDEADQELAKALASDGIERLFFALVAVPTAIAEHFLRLALTGVAMFLYAGVPFAMLFAFFIYTQAFLGAYLRQFINLLIETLMSVIIVAIMIGLLAAAAQQGIGLYIGASIITFIVLLWRIKSALKLAAAAFDLFGGSVITGGVGGMEVARMGHQAVTGTAMLAGAALTGGATVAAGGAVLATAAALQADGRNEGAYLGTDPNKTDGRVRQLKTIAGYALGRSETARSLIEGSHEARTLVRNFRDGDVQPHDPDMLDYLRAGSSMSGFGSSPWLAMRFSPSLRAAYDEIGGRRYGNGARDAAFDGDGEPVDLPGALPTNGVAGEGGRNDRSARRGVSQPPADNDINDTSAGDQRSPLSTSLWRQEPATQRQLAYLQQLGVAADTGLTRGQASDLIGQARQTQRSQPERSGNGEANEQSPRGSTVSPNDQLASRFASLEQALTNLTEALANLEGNGRVGNGRADELADTSVNGAVPDWLRETDEPSSPSAAAQDVGLVSDDDADADAVQNVNIVSAAPDLDHDGREDKYETMDVPSAGSIHLEPYQVSRGQVINDSLAHLADPHSLAGQAAQRTLVTYTGENNARLIQGAVGQHTATAVQEAAEATANLVTQYRAQGMDDAAVLAAFQSGEAAAAIREATAAQDSPTPLTDAQLSAVADMVLLPQRRLTRTELVGVIGREATAGAADEQSIVHALGMPIGFGGQTGNVRGVMAGARAMNLSPADLTRLAEMIQDGLRDVVQAELADRGYRPEMVRHFVSDMAALPGAMVVPQSAAVKTIAAAVTSAADGAGVTAVSAPQPEEE